MEIEAKYRIANAGVLRRLARAPKLGDYALGPPAVRTDQDVYLDTPDLKLHRAGLYLRRRENAEGVCIALKQMAAAPDGVLRREEWELRVATGSVAGHRLRDLLARVGQEAIGDADLVPLVTLSQERCARRVTRGVRVVAELSLDVVTVGGGSSPHRWCEAEVEMLGDGLEEDLSALGSVLRDVWRLTPERRSKFERAYALVAEPAHPGSCPPRAIAGD